jgi:hypothetical protein
MSAAAREFNCDRGLSNDGLGRQSGCVEPPNEPSTMPNQTRRLVR